MRGAPLDMAVEDLAFAYGRSGFSLHVPTLRIAAGNHVAIVGPSGSGKSTLLRLIAGIHRPHRGSVLLGSTDIAAMNDRDRRAFRITNIGLVFQDFQLIDYLNVAENIRLPYRIHRRLRWTDEAAQRAHHLAEAVGLADSLLRPVDELSQGEQQRVAICRALVTQPRLLLADEPTGNLDRSNTRTVMDMLLGEAAKQQATLITVTHDLTLLDRFDEVIDLGDLTDPDRAVRQAGGTLRQHSGPGPA